MSNAQRWLLISSMAIGALGLHAWHGEWKQSNFLTVELVRGFGWIGDLWPGMVAPAALLIAAAFLFLGRQRPISSPRP